MQFITTDQRIAVENFELGVVYTVAFSSGDSFTGSCTCIGVDFVTFQRTAPEYIFCLTMTTAADIAGIDPLGDDIGKILTYTGSVPVSIKTDGTPLLDYLITGSTIQSGTPTPDNPIMPQGTGERTGNLFDITPNANIGYNQDVGSDVSENPGLLRVSASDNGMILTADSSWVDTAWKIQARVGMTYYISFWSMSSNLRATIYTADGNNKVTRKIANYSKNFPNNKRLTILSDERYIVISISVNAIATVEITKPMIATDIIPYEPYGYKIPISSANTTTPVYLGEVQTTRRIKKLVLTGKESFEDANSCFILWLYSVQYPNPKQEIIYCTHYKGRTPTYRESLTNGQCMITKNQNQIAIKDLSYATIDDFKAYLQQQYAAGTPVTLWYALAEPETGILNEPLMRIGDYADTLSYRQSGVNIPTTDGLNIFDIDTTVKPSEVYLKYFSPLF